MSIKRLVTNKIRTPDGKILESRSVHDYRTYRDKNGKVYMVDGGLEYLRRNVHNDAPYEELSIYTDAPHEIIREEFTWGTYGRAGDKPKTYVLLCEMSDEHIQAIIDNKCTVQYLLDIFVEELRYREEHDLHVYE